LAKRRPVDNSIAGDTITAISNTPTQIRLCVEDHEARRLCLEPQTNLFKVRLANTEERRDSASYLIQRRYAWRGYAVGDQKPQAPTRITIAAHDRTGTAGTVTVGLDSPDAMFVDGLYMEEANSLRRAGRRLAEFTKLAIDNNVNSKPLLAALFHIAFIYARRIHCCTDLLIEVNPRHVSFYRRMLGFEQAGPERGDSRVGAPAVLLRLELEHAEAQIGRFGGQSKLASFARSLYTYAFSQDEERMVERRLRDLG